MIVISNRFVEHGRELALRGTITLPNDEVVQIDGRDILSVSIQENVAGNSVVPLGTASAASYTLILNNTGRRFEKGGGVVGRQALEKSIISLEIGAADRKRRYTWSPLGEFVASEAKASEQDIHITVTGEDRMGGTLAEPFADDESLYPCTIGDIARRIATSAVVAYENEPFPNASVIVSQMPKWKEGTTRRDVLGCIATVAGGFARIDRTGALEIVVLMKAQRYQLTAHNYYSINKDGASWGPINTLVIKEGQEELARYNIDEEIVNTEKNTVEISGNPLLTEEVVPGMLAALTGLAFDGATVRWQGDPTVQCGDMLQVTDTQRNRTRVLITKQAISCSPGFAMTSTCKATGTAKSAGQTSGMRIITPSGGLNTGTFEGAINAIRNKIVGSATYQSASVRLNEGILMEINNPESDDYGALYLGPGIWALANQKDADGLWDWQVAATGSGIVANAITAGTLNATLIKILGTDQFYWDADNIYIKDQTDPDKQIRIGRYDGTNYGIGFTTNDGETFTQVIDYTGIRFDTSGLVTDSEFTAFQNAVSTQITSINGELQLKASQVVVEEVVESVENVAQHVDDVEQTVEEVAGLVDENTDAIEENARDIKLKVDREEYVKSAQEPKENVVLGTVWFNTASQTFFECTSLLPDENAGTTYTWTLVAAARVVTSGINIDANQILMSTPNFVLELYHPTDPTKALIRMNATEIVFAGADGKQKLFFAMDTGDLTLEGVVNATGGTLGGFIIENGRIRSANVLLDSNGKISVGKFTMDHQNGFSFGDEEDRFFAVSFSEIYLNRTVVINPSMLPTTYAEANLHLADNGVLYRSLATSGGSAGFNGVVTVEPQGNFTLRATCTVNEGTPPYTYTFTIYKNGYFYLKGVDNQTSNQYIKGDLDTGTYVFHCTVKDTNGNEITPVSHPVFLNSSGGGGTVPETSNLTAVATVNSNALRVGQTVTFSCAAYNATGSVTYSYFITLPSGHWISGQGSTVSWVTSETGNWNCEFTVTDSITSITALAPTCNVSASGGGGNPTSGVTTTTVRIRSRPSTTNSTTITTLSAGTRVSIIGPMTPDASGADMYWWPVRYVSSEPEEYIGYISADYLDT